MGLKSIFYYSILEHIIMVATLSWWQHYHQCTSDKGVKYAKCKACPQLQDYSIKDGFNPAMNGESGVFKKDGTGNMKHHLLRFHKHLLPTPTVTDDQTQLDLNTPFVVGVVYKAFYCAALLITFLFINFSSTRSALLPCWYHLWSMAIMHTQLWRNQISETTRPHFALHSSISLLKI